MIDLNEYIIKILKCDGEPVDFATIHKRLPTQVKAADIRCALNMLEKYGIVHVFYYGPLRTRKWKYINKTPMPPIKTPRQASENHNITITKRIKDVELTYSVTSSTRADLLELIHFIQLSSEEQMRLLAHREG
jgi:hypothetical protein